MADVHQDVVHLVRFLVDGKGRDAVSVGRRLLRQVAKERPDLREAVQPLAAELRSSALRRALPGVVREAAPVPVDTDSRLELVRRHEPVDMGSLTWPPPVRQALDQIVYERARVDDLVAAGLTPSRSALFVGPPGVGKTVAAHQVASQLGRDLFVLDLAAVMSSFLGRTGNNVRTVLDFAARSGGVLLLDEFDAIAKRRDDAADVGELRRLVNVLLQSIDDWPSDGLLIAATNHPELLDPAVWRRFEMVVQFPTPDAAAVHAAVARLLPEEDDGTIALASALLEGGSYADIARSVLRARRESILFGVDIEDALVRTLQDHVRALTLKERLDLAKRLLARGYSQRRTHDITGLSRDTLRRHLSKNNRSRKENNRNGS